MAEPHFWDAYPDYRRLADGTWIATLDPQPTLGGPTTTTFGSISGEGETQEEARRALQDTLRSTLLDLPTAEEQRAFLSAFYVGTSSPKPRTASP